MGERWMASRKDRLHVLRHAYASIIPEPGESVVTLARWFGHSSPTTTLDYYTHFMPSAGGKGRVRTFSDARGTAISPPPSEPSRGSLSVMRPEALPLSRTVEWNLRRLGTLSAEAS
jgi:hypothetical protein